jgi:hypothetical protein
VIRNYVVQFLHGTWPDEHAGGDPGASASYCQ